MPSVYKEINIPTLCCLPRKAGLYGTITWHSPAAGLAYYYYNNIHMHTKNTYIATDLIIVAAVISKIEYSDAANANELSG